MRAIIYFFDPARQPVVVQNWFAGDLKEGDSVWCGYDSANGLVPYTFKSGEIDHVLVEHDS